MALYFLGVRCASGLLPACALLGCSRRFLPSLLSARARFFQAFSLHSYGKEGYALWQTGNATNVSVQATRTTPIPASQPTLPFVVTEHAAHTTATWNTLTTNPDTYYEAARLASQMLFMASNGWESYVFKV